MFELEYLYIIIRPPFQDRNDGLLRLLFSDSGDGFCPPTLRSRRVTRAGGGKNHVNQLLNLVNINLNIPKPYSF